VRVPASHLVERVGELVRRYPATGMSRFAG
jgi:hypothetical protein